MNGMVGVGGGHVLLAHQSQAAREAGGGGRGWDGTNGSVYSSL
jgi:hypothetical protein